MGLPVLLKETAGQRIVLDLHYKEDVGGSSPSTPTELCFCLLIRLWSGRVLLCVALSESLLLNPHGP